jgi:predicted nucleic acid-binding protein
MGGKPGYLIDTNVLLRLTRLRDPEYGAIQTVLERLSDSGATFYYTLQNIAEFWNVCTRPVDRNGFGLSIEETDRLVQAIERSMMLAPETGTVYAVWRRFVRDLKISGVRVHDARLAALMEVHGLHEILTLNVADFARFPGVSAIHPKDVA